MSLTSLLEDGPLSVEAASDLQALTRREFEGKYKIGFRVWKRLRARTAQSTIEVPQEEASFEALYEAVATHAEVQRKDDRDDTFHAEHWGDQPVGLLLSGDWHVGSQWCDYRQLRSDMEKIGLWRLQHPGALHLAHLGDGWDGFLATGGRTASGLYEETETRIDRQERIFTGLARLAGDWKVLLYGCHPSWSLTQAGRDPLTPVATVLGAVNGGFGVELEALVGDFTYRLLLRHKTRRESALNTTNAQRAMDDDLGPAGHRADVVGLGHFHFNDMQKRPKAGRTVVYLRVGSYKGGDTFARSIGATMSKQADPGNPLVILLPKEKRVIPYHGHDWREGLEELARLRGRA